MRVAFLLGSSLLFTDMFPFPRDVGEGAYTGRTGKGRTRTGRTWRTGRMGRTGRTGKGRAPLMSD